MATKIQQILESHPNSSLFFGYWLTKQGLNSKEQHSYMKRGWLTRISKGVYALKGKSPTLLQTVATYNSQLGKQCLGKPKAYLFTDKENKLPLWIVQGNWDMAVKYMTTSFLGTDLKAVEPMVVESNSLLVSSPERAFLECLHLPDAASSLLDMYYIMESLTTLRPKLVQSLLESCTSQKVKRLFVYMAEKAAHPWFKALKLDSVTLGTSRYMIVPTGKYIAKYNMTIPKELAEYE